VRLEERDSGSGILLRHGGKRGGAKVVQEASYRVGFQKELLHAAGLVVFRGGGVK